MSILYKNGQVCVQFGTGDIRVVSAADADKPEC